MDYRQFKQAALAILDAQPVGTWMRLGAGFMASDGAGSLLCAPEPNHPVPDMLAWIEGCYGETDESAWNGDAFDGMTAQEIQSALDTPEFHLFGVPSFPE